VSRLIVGLVVLVSLFVAAPASAAPGALNVLVTGNDTPTPEMLAAAIKTEAGVASADFFNTDTATPTAESMVPYDLIVSLGDSSYFDSTLWGNQLADYVDAGGAVLQAAYDNWDNVGSDPVPLGRFDSGGYPPLLRGDNENINVTLGTLVLPDHPIVQGLPALPTSDNTTTPLAVGATLLAKWSDDRNAIAFKGRVAAISASPGDEQSIPGIARLARNTGNYLGRRNVSVTKSGTGTGTVTGTRSGASCGQLCGGVFAFGTQFAFTATPGRNSVFAGWTGSCTGSGLCTPLVNGVDLSVGAIFNKARFGKRTLVSLSAASRKASRGRVKVRVNNRNKFSITGSLSGKVGKTKLKAKKFSVKAKGRKTVVLKLPASLRMALAQNGKLRVALTTKVKSPAGTTRTVKKRITVRG
jgi:hypothetical protein